MSDLRQLRNRNTDDQLTVGNLGDPEPIKVQTPFLAVVGPFDGDPTHVTPFTYLHVPFQRLRLQGDTVFGKRLSFMPFGEVIFQIYNEMPFAGYGPGGVPNTGQPLLLQGYYASPGPDAFQAVIV